MLTLLFIWAIQNNPVVCLGDSEWGALPMPTLLFIWAIQNGERLPLRMWPRPSPVLRSNLPPQILAVFQMFPSAIISLNAD